MHRLDFGLDLEFGDLVIGVTWGVPGQALTIAAQSLLRDLPYAVGIDATGFAPWKDAVGRNVHDVLQGKPHVDAAVSPDPCRWSMAIEYRPDLQIWLAAANYLDPEGPLLPCGDELIVIGDRGVAARLGLT